MDMATRFTSIYVFINTALHEAVFKFQDFYLHDFWLRENIQGNKAIRTEGFKKYLDEPDRNFLCVQPNRIGKTQLKSKHGMIRKMYLTL